MTNRIKAWLRTRVGRLVIHDATVALAAGVAAWEAAGHSLTWGAAVAAGVVAGKAFLRLLLPVPVAGRHDAEQQPATTGNTATSGYLTVAYTSPRPVRVVAEHAASTVVLIPEFHSPHGGRLGRHVNHDPRSRDFRVQRQRAPLRSVRHARHVPIYDQGDLGSCVPHAGKGVLSTAPFHRRFASERGIIGTYKELTASDDIPGQYPPEDTGSDGLSFAKLAVRKGWCSRYEHAFGIADLIHALQTSAVMCGTNWLESMDQPDPDGIIHALSGGVRGGHEYEADEYRQRGTVPNIHEDLIGFDNSWGQWGAAGRFYVPVAVYADLLEQQGDVTILVA